MIRWGNHVTRSYSLDLSELMLTAGSVFKFEFQINLFIQISKNERTLIQTITARLRDIVDEEWI